MKNIKQRIIIISIITVIIILAVIFIYLLQKRVVKQTPIIITSSIPAEGSVNVSVFDPITLNFSQAINSSTLHISSDPSENWEEAQTAQNSIEIRHQQYLKVATKYKITVLQNGTVVGVLDFETAHEQNDPRQLQSLQSELDKNYPLASLTPYQTLSYRVVYSAPLTLEIDVKDPNVIQQNIIQEVQSWVRSNGVDPSTHKYNIVLPSPTP